MRIGIIGGVERSESAYRRIAKEHGHELEYHSGHTAGRGVHTLASLVERCDRIVIVTDVNSHGAVGVAKRLARARSVPTDIFKNVGPSRFGAWLDGLAAAGRAPAI